MLAPTWPGFAPVFVANDMGYFKELGLTVDIKFEDDRANVMAAMRAAISRSTCAPSASIRAGRATTTTPGIIIGTIDKSLGGDGVIADGSINARRRSEGQDGRGRAEYPGPAAAAARAEEGRADPERPASRISPPPIRWRSSPTPPIAAVATYEPFMSQAVKTMPARKRQDPRFLEGQRHHHRHHHRPAGRPRRPTRRNTSNFLSGIYKAVDLYKTDPAEFIELAAPHYNLSEAEVKEILDTSLAYTPLPRRHGLYRHARTSPASSTGFSIP